jgi:hypothetical protein
MQRPARVPSQLSESLHKRLNAYALAASAAGVGMLALAQPAEARIVYTSTHKVVSNGSLFLLDLNNDGSPDFIISNWVFAPSGGLSVCPENPAANCSAYRGPQANAIWGKPRGHSRGGSASVLPSGFKVGPDYPHFHRGNNRMVAFACFSNSCTEFSSAWKGDVQRKYLGFKFFINGKAHYGWARLNVSFTKGVGNLTATLTGYAYETIPNKPLITGKTKVSEEKPGATLGALATGAAGLSTWRQK